MCKTVSGFKPNAICSFPFREANVTYNRCTRIQNKEYDALAWCSVRNDESGERVKDEWGICEPSCQPDTCLTDEKKCIGSRVLDKGKITSSENDRITFDARTEAPCIFPFKYRDIQYHKCTNFDEDIGFWCATSVDENGNVETYGYCSESCQKEKDLSTTTIVLTILICFLLFVSIIIVFYYRAKRNKGKEVEDTMLEGNIALLNSYMVLNEQAAHLSYSGKNEIERSKFEIGRKLGGGSFGSVHEGMVEDPIHPGQKNKVAIKSVNNPLDPAQIYSLICEIKVLDQLEMHPNLVNMMGACTTKFKSGKIWLLLEYCSHGDMKNFLLKNRDVISQGLHYQRVPHEILNIRLFLKWSHSICKGMEYLASKNIMHGDLAARNILITNSDNNESYLAKIGDFGLSKPFYEKASYHKQERTSIPWKWMAVDYFETGVLTLSSDVWSFGVVFWEILSMGRFPYAGGDAEETIKKIKDGFRLPVPDEVKVANWLTKCYNEVTEMCWQVDPKQRCNFPDLVKTFDTLLTTEEKEKFKRLEQSIFKKVAKHEKPQEAISFNNLQDNASTKSMNDIEVVYSNPTDEVIELEYVDPVVEATL